MSCQEFSERYWLLVDGSLDAENSRRCLEHAGSCPSCHRLIEEARACSAALGTLARGKLSARASQSILETVEKEWGRSESVLAAMPRRIFALRLIPAAVAAALLVGLGTYWLLRTKAPSPPPPTIAPGMAWEDEALETTIEDLDLLADGAEIPFDTPVSEESDRWQTLSGDALAQLYAAEEGFEEKRLCYWELEVQDIWQRLLELDEDSDSS